MKQSVTQEQLQELSPKAKEKLLSLTSWDYLPHGAQMLLHNSDFYLSDFLTIGRMIELLDEAMPISIMGHQSAWDGGVWYWNGGSIPQELTESAIEKSLKHFNAPELCDALWQAVKEVLEVNNG